MYGISRGIPQSGPGRSRARASVIRVMSAFVKLVPRSNPSDACRSASELMLLGRLWYREDAGRRRRKRAFGTAGREPGRRSERGSRIAVSRAPAPVRYFDMAT